MSNKTNTKTTTSTTKKGNAFENRPSNAMTWSQAKKIAAICFFESGWTHEQASAFIDKLCKNFGVDEEKPSSKKKAESPKAKNEPKELSAKERVAKAKAKAEADEEDGEEETEEDGEDEDEQPKPQPKQQPTANTYEFNSVGVKVNGEASKPCSFKVNEDLSVEVAFAKRNGEATEEVDLSGKGVSKGNGEVATYTFSKASKLYAFVLKGADKQNEVRHRNDLHYAKRTNEGENEARATAYEKQKKLIAKAMKALA